MNKYKIILIIFFSILSLSNLMAQKGGIKVSGKVVSSYANRPLPDAIITISGVDKTVEGDSLGRFSVDGVPAGKSHNLGMVSRFLYQRRTGC